MLRHGRTSGPHVFYFKEQICLTRVKFFLKKMSHVMKLLFWFFTLIHASRFLTDGHNNIVSPLCNLLDEEERGVYFYTQSAPKPPSQFVTASGQGELLTVREILENSPFRTYKNDLLESLKEAIKGNHGEVVGEILSKINFSLVSMQEALFLAANNDADDAMNAILLSKQYDPCDLIATLSISKFKYNGKAEDPKATILQARVLKALGRLTPESPLMKKLEEADNKANDDYQLCCEGGCTLF